MDVEVRRLRPGEEIAFVRSERIPFLDPHTGDEDQVKDDERSAGKLEIGRAWVAVEEGRFVGNANVYSLDMSLPSAPGRAAPVVPFAGVSGVGVHPTHRRKGLLRRLMSSMFDDARDRGEPLAGLLASESVIYGRFGFGHATSAVELSIDTRDTRFAVPAPELDLRLVDRDEARKVLPEIFDRQRLTRAGEPSRDPVTWDQYLRDSERDRGGAMGMFHAVCDEGWVSYRVHDARVMRGERAHLVVTALRGMTPEVEAALWRFVFDVDLVGPVTAQSRPVDEPLRWRLADPRRLQVTGVFDRLWLRVLDTPAALCARGYRCEGSLTMDVLPAGDSVDAHADPAPGRWVLEVGPDGSSCRAARSGEDADIRLGLADLGSLYLGGFSASTVSTGGRIEELKPGGLDRADAVFATPLAPYTGTGF